jgi:hypothetical protein
MIERKKNKKNIFKNKSTHTHTNEQTKKKKKIVSVYYTEYLIQTEYYYERSVLDS